MSVASFPPSVSPRFLAEYYAPTRKLVVDRAASTVSGVKLMGTVSKNGREFSPAAMRDFYNLSEGAKININHNAGDLGATRGYADRFGSVLSRTLEADGIYGTIKINPKHPLAEQFFWDAENAPQNCGMSPVYSPGKTSRTSGSKLLIESVASLRSYDVVTEPATTNGLAEGVGSSGAGAAFDSADFVRRLTGRRVKPLEVTTGGKSFAESITRRNDPCDTFARNLKATRATKALAGPFDAKQFAERLTAPSAR